ncbi:MAG TPA: hypothetical protein VFW49_08735 [Fluviicoccus sp.]|nr:hypothetical protein [Fluviicoccus sp.]
MPPHHPDTDDAMSWDITLFRFARPVSDTVADDEALLPLGSLSEVHATVSRHFPGTDWSDPAWGQWEDGGDSVEFNLGDDDPADCLMLHVRAGPAIVERLRTLCRATGWQAVDCASGTLIGG